MSKAPVRYTLGVGRRKESVARVKLVPGTGKISINKREVDDYLTIGTQKMLAFAALEITKTKDKYDLTIKVQGGGGTGQAGAIRQGVARALLKVSPELRAVLKENGLLTRDSRMKERKKYGQPGARKRFQFSKR